MIKIFIETWGCSANHSDSEIMHAILKKAKYKIVPENKADIFILNSCSVKGPSESSLYRFINKHKNKKIIITGCIPEANKQLINTTLKNISIVGLNNLHQIAEAVKHTLAGERVVMLNTTPIDKSILPKQQLNPATHIEQIASGCLNNCTYCSTKLARGDLYSYSPARITANLKKAVSKGTKEIWLTSQDNSMYGLDRKTNLVALLNKISKIRGKFYVRNGMSNPQYILKYLHNLIKAYKAPKIYKFLHIPVQSGSNKVLKDMKRGYTIEQFKKIITTFKKEIPQITIATDIICGYPTETEEDWKQTMDLINWLKPDVLNISRFWPRPGTKAAKLKQLSGKIINARARELSALFCNFIFKKNRKWLNWEGEIIISEKGKYKNTWIGRNFAYKPIVIASHKNILGKIFYIKVASTAKTHLCSQICNKNHSILIT